MSFDKTAALYVYCANYHTGQGSRLYRIMSCITERGINLTDRAWEAIQDGTGRAYLEWSEAHAIYQDLATRQPQ